MSLSQINPDKLKELQLKVMQDVSSAIIPLMRIGDQLEFSNIYQS